MNKNNIESFKSNLNLDYSEVLKRAVKYTLEGLAVAVAARYIPKETIEVREIIMIAITAACVFAILDMYAPSVSDAARQGAGFAIGTSALGLSIPTRSL
jgi:hypothetical protein